MLPRRDPRPALSSEEPAANQRPASLPSHLGAEWDAVCRGHHNLLLVGSSAAAKEMLQAMRSRFREPVQRYSPKAGAVVPQPVDGTLVLLEVARLNGKQQAQLLQWLDQSDPRPQVQIVSTTSRPLFSLVESGAFLADLYYKLNIVRMDLVGSGSSGRKPRLHLD